MSADNVALPAARIRRPHAAARLLLSTGRAAINRYLLPTGPTAANPQQRRAAAGWDRQTDGRTDDRYIDHAPHAQRAAPKLARNVLIVCTVDVLFFFHSRFTVCFAA